MVACDDKLTEQEVALKDLPVGTDFYITDISPFDTIFLGAYAYSEQKDVYLDAVEAKNIWKDKWREARKSKLEALDLAYMRATETQNVSEIARIVSEKQELRDVTNTPIPGTTPEEIKAVWPEILN